MNNRIRFAQPLQQFVIIAAITLTSLSGLINPAMAQYTGSGSTYQQPSSYSGNTYSSPSYGTTNTYTTTPDTRYTNGYTRENGTRVNPYFSTAPDNTNLNNYSTQGNANPYTGTTGSRARDYSSEAYNYGQGRTIQTGPRGGQYYTNDAGNKVYVPKRNNPY